MKQSSRKHTWRNRIVVGVIAVALFYLWMTLRPPLWYYHMEWEPQELPQRLIRPAFRKIAGWDLPVESKELRALFHGGRDPAIFVRLQTDSEGISHIREQMVPFGVEFEPFSGIPGFFIVSQWEEWSGIRIRDHRVIESGLRLGYNHLLNGSFEIVIDTQRNNVYIRAWLQ